MRAGRLRHRVRVERPITTRSSSGAYTSNFELVKVVWAEISPIRGREKLTADQIIADMDSIIRMRWSPSISAIDATWRVVFGSTIYNLASPPTNVRMLNAELELFCRTGANDGQ